MNRHSHEIDMCNGPLLKKMLLFAVPVIVTSILQIVYNAADMVVVGRFAGSNSLASVGATSQIINLLVGFFNGVSVGASVVVARQYGAGDQRAVNETVHTSIALSLLCGLLITVVGLSIADQMLMWMQTPPEVLPGASLYLRIYFIGIPAMMVYNFAAAVLRSVGDTRRSMYFLMISGAVNVALNLLFVVGLRMDVAGVAWSTTISQYLACAMMVICLIRSENCVHLDVRRLRMNRKSAGEILRIGLPSGVQASMFSISNVLIQSGINSFGAAAIAANSSAGSIEGFASLGTGALYQVILSFTGQNMGARKYDRIRKITQIGLLLSLLNWLVLGGLIFLLREPLMRIFSDDAQVIELGGLKLTILMSGYFFVGAMNALVGTLRGMGYVTAPMINSILGVCVFRVIWMYTFFVWWPTLTTLYVSYPVSWVLVSAAHLITYWLLRRKLDRQIASRPENE